MSADNVRQTAAAARAAGQDQLATLFEVWERTGKAPAGLEAYGIRSGDPLASSQSSSKAASYNYKSDPNFAQDVAYLKSNQDAAAQLDSSAQEFISDYGYDGYLALRKAAGLD
ncbi:hypothetical protein D3C73_1419140 [compost metagenome]